MFICFLCFFWWNNKLNNISTIYFIFNKNQEHGIKDKCAFSLNPQFLEFLFLPEHVIAGFAFVNNTGFVQHVSFNLKTSLFPLKFSDTRKPRLFKTSQSELKGKQY